MNNQALYISPERYAEKWSLHPESVRDYCRKKILPARKIGRIWRIRADAVPNNAHY